MNTIINIPKDANHLIHTLQNHGHKAYCVGGCCRDAILGLKPHDWDLCISATPEEMLEIFKDYHTYDAGLKHGTLTVMLHGEPYEITTFRKETGYSDSRHPDSVEFVSDICEDLARRDFTINAMAYNEEEGLVDPFCGIEDIKNKVIRCVGDAKERFNEDALRIMRAIRFAAKLDFEIETNTSIQIHSLKNHLKDISQERITSEFCKIAQTDKFADMVCFYTDVFATFIPEITPMIDFNQKNPYHQHTVFMHTLYAVENCISDDLITRLAVFFHDIGKPECAIIDKDDPNRLHFWGHGEVSAKMTDEIMRRMKFDNKTREAVVELVYYHDAKFEVSERNIRHWLGKIGPEQYERLLDVRVADIMGQKEEYQPQRLEKVRKMRALYKEMMKKEQCYTLKELAISGTNLINVGYKPGKELGCMLKELLQMVVDGELENDEETLVSYAERKLKYKDAKNTDVERM